MKNVNELQIEKDTYLKRIYDHLELFDVNVKNYKNKLYKYNLFKQFIYGLSLESFTKINEAENCKTFLIYEGLKSSFHNCFFLVHPIFELCSVDEKQFLINRYEKAKQYIFNISEKDRIYIESEIYFFISYGYFTTIEPNNFKKSFYEVLKIVPKSNLIYFINLMAFSKITKDTLNDIIIHSQVDKHIFAIKEWCTTFKVMDINSDVDDEVYIDFVQTQHYSSTYVYCNNSDINYVDLSNNSNLHDNFTEVENLGYVNNMYLDDYYEVNGTYYESYDYYINEYGGNYVDDYHSGECTTVNFNNNSKFRIGFEIEKEDEHVKESVNIRQFKDNTDCLFRKEHDGSLSENGFELITPVYELNSESIFKHLQKYEIIKDHIDADVDNETCGGHISISNIEKDTWKFYNDIEYYIPLLYSMYPNRCNQNYCKAKTKDKLKSENEKYQAIKIYSNRIELRIFPAVKNLNQLIFRTKLLEIILKYPTTNYFDSAKIIQTKIVPFLIESKVYDKEKIKRLKLRLKDSYYKYGFSDIDFDNETDFETEHFDN